MESGGRGGGEGRAEWEGRASNLQIFLPPAYVSEEINLYARILCEKCLLRYARSRPAEPVAPASLPPHAPWGPGTHR